MPISVVDGPSLVISGHAPSGLVRLDPDHALVVSGSKARIVDISSGLMVFGTEDTHNTSGGDPKSILVDESTYRVCTISWSPSRFLRASMITSNLTSDTFTSSNQQLRDSFTENPSFPFMDFEGAACLVNGKDVVVFWHEYDSFIGGSGTWKSFYMYLTITGATITPGTATEFHSMTVPVVVPDVNYGVIVDAIPTGSTSAILLMSNGSYRTVSVAGTSVTVGAATAALGGFESKTGAVLTGGLAASEADTGKVATFTSSFVGASAASQVANGAKLTPLQSRTAIACGPQDGKRVVFNGNSFSSVDNAFTYDASGSGGGYPQAMGVLNDTLLVANGPVSNTYLTYLDQVPTSDPFPFSQGGNRLWQYKLVKSPGGGFEITSRGVVT